MKTRNFFTTMMFFLITTLIVSATDTKLKNTQPAFGHESISASIPAAENLMAFTFLPAVSEPVSENTSEFTMTLEQWINGREDWEQSENEMIAAEFLNGESMLESWITGRTDWEQSENQSVNAEFLNGEALLDQWFNGRENWETTGNEMTETEIPNGGSELEQWITGRENWEHR